MNNIILIMLVMILILPCFICVLGMIYCLCEFINYELKNKKEYKIKQCEEDGDE